MTDSLLEAQIRDQIHGRVRLVIDGGGCQFVHLYIYKRDDSYFTKRGEKTFYLTEEKMSALLEMSEPSFDGISYDHNLIKVKNGHAVDELLRQYICKDFVND